MLTTERIHSAEGGEEISRVYDAMSMLDAFFTKGVFKAAKCKTLLKLTIPRIKLLRNRREIQLKQMRKDIAKLLENGQEATARIRVEHIIREENMMAAQEILELFCELITVRLPIIEAQKECPLDLKEAISSICFAAPRCADLPELQQVQLLFVAKYGKEFVSAATELRPDCGVNRQIIELLSIRAPSVETKMKLLKEIAEEHELDWDPSVSEAEYLKPHEDLLNGPDHFTSGSTLPLPKEKHNDSPSSGHMNEFHVDPDSDAEFDSLDLPEVPKESVRASDTPSAPGIVSNIASVPHDLGHEVAKSIDSNEDLPHENSTGTEEHEQDPSNSASYSNPKQFIPFVNPPPLHTPDLEMLKLSEPAAASIISSFDDRVDSTKSEPVPSPTTAPPFSSYTNQREPTFSSSTLPSALPEKQSEQVISPSSTLVSGDQNLPTPSFSRIKSDMSVDLQDVLAAAKAAAETAEHAASAARAAASLAEVRITDMLARRKSMASQNYEDPENFQQPDTSEKPKFDKQESFNGSIEDDAAHGLKKFDSSTLFSEAESPNMKDQNPNYQPAHLPQRLPSLEDDPYFTYPNLFSSKDSKTEFIG